ncbi:hypothetical protein HHK36_032555 [Tetracentron sinense]|uniref:MSP domain-containing protein n=1 Tax=Tetracentron sinense TaxID=13715 RepID=A0A835CXG6_TETSI|nr:hypothetical protein HHK36_032555 [Tetracentron sinense]
MDKLISLEPSNQVVIRIELGQKCYGELTLRNVMYTMPVAFILQPMNKNRYTVRPQSGIISPLSTLVLEITYVSPPNSNLPDSFPHSDDSFLLHSVVVPGAAVKDPSSTFDSIPNDLPMVLWKKFEKYLKGVTRNGGAADSVDEHGQTLLHLAIAQSRPDLLIKLAPKDPNPPHGGSTPAARGGHMEVMRLLLLKGANMNALTADGYTALHLAVDESQRDSARLLLASGAKADIRNTGNGDTPHT